MIIRKPYAFLIKNFKRIHVVLLVLSLFLAYKIFDVNAFVNEFMKLGVYDLYADPITKHITFIMSLSIIVMVVGSLSLLLLLRYKGKPWKLYLVPFITYLSLFFVLGIIKSFFGTYTVDVDTANLRFSRDLLAIFAIGQFPVIGIFIMRTFALDINKFNFNSDEEFLQLSEADREEIEISFDIDVNSFKRLYRRLLRNLSYFYKEHKKISRLVIGIISIILLFNMYTFVFVTHRSYKENDFYHYHGLDIRVSNSYITNKDYGGNEISKDNNFIIVEFIVENNTDESIKLDMSSFHLKAGNKDYITTESTYGKEFYDLGKTYSKVRKFNPEEKTKFIVIYKADKKIRKGRFVLYHQEKDDNNILRKISLNIKDISKMGDMVNNKLGDDVDVSMAGVDDKISIESYSYQPSINYSARKCYAGECRAEEEYMEASDGEKILVLDLSSSVWEAKNFIDFFKMCGKIDYKDSSGLSRQLDIDFAVKNNYLGKVVYLRVPDEVSSSKDVKIVFTLRNRRFSYKLN